LASSSLCLLVGVKVLSCLGDFSSRWNSDAPTQHPLFRLVIHLPSLGLALLGALAFYGYRRYHLRPDYDPIIDNNPYDNL